MITWLRYRIGIYAHVWQSALSPFNWFSDNLATLCPHSFSSRYERGWKWHAVQLQQRSPFNYTMGFLLTREPKRDRERAIDNEWGTAICLSHTVAYWACSLSKCAWQTPRAEPSPARHTNPFKVHHGRDKIWAWPIFFFTLCSSLTAFDFLLTRFH